MTTKESDLQPGIFFKLTGIYLLTPCTPCVHSILSVYAPQYELYTGEPVAVLVY